MPIRLGSHAALVTVFSLFAIASQGVISQEQPTELTFPIQVSKPSSDEQVFQDIVLPASRSTQDDQIQVRDAVTTVDLPSATTEPRRYAGNLVTPVASPSGEIDAYNGAISDHAKEDIVMGLTDLEAATSQSASLSDFKSPSSPIISGEPPAVFQPDQPTSSDVPSPAEKEGSNNSPVEASPSGIVITSSRATSNVGSRDSSTPAGIQRADGATSDRFVPTTVAEIIPPYPLASPWLPSLPLRSDPLAPVTASASSVVPLSVASPAATLPTVPPQSIPTTAASPSPPPPISRPSQEPAPQISAQPTSVPLTFVRLPATSAQIASSSRPSSPPPSVGVFDPRSFGAAGNGVQDDTAALNAAFAAACAYRVPTPPPRGRAARPTAPPPSAPRGLPLKKQAEASNADPNKSVSSVDSATGGRLTASAALATAAAEQGERRVAQQQQSSARNDGAVASQLNPRQVTTDAAATPVQGATSGDANGTTAMDAAALAPERATLLLPAGRTFLVASWITWHGPCRGNGLLLQIDGLLQFEPNAAKRIARGAVMVITRVDGLTVAGAGRIDGGGDLLWRRPANSRPHLLLLAEMRRVVVTGITLSNAPMMHLVLRLCVGAVVRGIATRSPDSSPNTDSIHVSACSHVSISDSWLHGGDDDISIVAGSSAISINNVTCTAGHGISIGSLGYGGKTACVSNVTVTNSVLSGLSNGLRIKTYQGGSGSVFNIRYENITMLNVERPIIIDQYYCDAEPCGSGVQALSIFNITYTNISATADGTTRRGIIRGIDLACSRTVPCTGISLSQVRITGSKRGGGAARVQQSLMETSSLSSFDPASQTTVRVSNAFGARDGRAFPLADRSVAANLDSAAEVKDAAAADVLVSVEQRVALAAQRFKCGV